LSWPRQEVIRRYGWSFVDLPAEWTVQHHSQYPSRVSAAVGLALHGPLVQLQGANDGGARQSVLQASSRSYLHPRLTRTREEGSRLLLVPPTIPAGVPKTVAGSSLPVLTLRPARQQVAGQKVTMQQRAALMDTPGVTGRCIRVPDAMVRGLKLLNPAVRQCHLGCRCGTLETPGASVRRSPAAALEVQNSLPPSLPPRVPPFLPSSLPRQG